jgi:hypothetical protein
MPKTSNALLMQNIKVINTYFVIMTTTIPTLILGYPLSTHHFFILNQTTPLTSLTLSMWM